jgi:uncharacterized coiled-coil DUF342 family protein
MNELDELKIQIAQLREQNQEYHSGLCEIYKAVSAAGTRHEKIERCFVILRKVFKGSE